MSADRKAIYDAIYGPSPGDAVIQVFQTKAGLWAANAPDGLDERVRTEIERMLGALNHR